MARSKRTDGNNDQKIDLVGALTEKEVARLLRVKPPTVAKWRRTGGNVPPHIKVSERVHLYPLKQLEEWQQRQPLLGGGAD